MKQIILTLDEEETEIVERFAKEWKMPKYLTIKTIILNFDLALKKEV